MTLGKMAKRLKSLAGAGGFEPPHGGTKIRCLTAWLRPIDGCLLRATPWAFKASRPPPPERAATGALQTACRQGTRLPTPALHWHRPLLVRAPYGSGFCLLAGNDAHAL